MGVWSLQEWAGLARLRRSTAVLGPARHVGEGVAAGVEAEVVEDDVDGARVHRLGVRGRDGCVVVGDVVRRLVGQRLGRPVRPPQPLVDDDRGRPSATSNRR
jgi:hypothetical protein